MDLIEEYLNAKLISAQTEEELRMIEASVERFLKVLAQNPARMFAALHAITFPTAPVCQSILDEVHELVRQEWRTVGSRYPERPTELLRIVILAALVSLARSNEQWADAVGLLLPTMVPFLDRNSADATIWQKLIDEFQGGYERRAEDMWSVPAAINLPKLELSEEAAAAIVHSGGAISADSMATAIAAAFTNTYGGENLENGNPHQVHGQLPQWADHASKQLSSLLVGSYAKSVRGKISGPDTKSLAAELETYNAGVVAQVTSAVHGQDLRTRLLWWKESGYSPMIQKSYRGLSNENVAIQAALDLAQWVPDRTPPSAFYFLQVAVDSFVANSNEAVALETYGRAAADHELSNAYNDQSSKEDSKPLIMVFDQESVIDWLNSVFDKDAKMKPANVAEHVLREVLASRILARIKPARKPKAT